MTAPAAARTRPAPRRRGASRKFVPAQHGAWAMLLLGAWLAGYPLTYYLLQAVKTGRLARVRAQLLVYGTATVLLGGLTLAWYPTLLWYAPAYAALLAVNAGYARRRAERALGNDLAAVVQSCLMVFMCATVAGAPPGAVLAPFLAVTAYFTGTVLYVKTMIRERGRRGYYWASIGYHAAAVVLGAWLGPAQALLFLLLLLRAAVLPRRQLSPKQVGLTEILACALLLLALII